MKIVVLDGYAANPGDLSWDELKSLGECTVYDRTAPAEVLERAAGADILLTNKVVLDATTIAALPQLKYIGVLATGYNIIDTAAAKERGITVTNIPAYSTPSVAQMVFAHILNITDSTRELVNAARLKQMKPNAILINTGRGPLVNEQDLADALNNGTIFAAGLDVLSQEPPRADNPLLTARNCYITPHIAWASAAARERLMQIMLDNIKAFLDGKPINSVIK